MVEYTRSLFLQCLDEWHAYPGKFRGLSADDQAAFLRGQGYASYQDLLVHVAAWWEEADGIVRDRVAGQARPAHKYDIDAFNAAAIARFKDTPNADVLEWYESRRQGIAKTVSALTDEWMQVRTIYGWLDAVLLEHLKEHGLDAPRFLLIDTLQREWGAYLDLYRSFSAEEKHAYLQKQGFARFPDVLAHIVAWWEAGIRVIGSGGDEDPCEGQDVDAFNAAAVQRFSKQEEPEVSASYERTRLVLLNLVGTAPDEVLSKPNVQSWLRSDVIEHYFEHRG